jgi:TonB-linked SusC/RagA family outer membrane protein
MTKIVLSKPYPDKYIWIKTWMVMRVTVFIIFVSAMQISARGYSQTISLSSKNITLQEAFYQIKQQTGYSFFWNQSLLDKAPPISVNVKDATVRQALDACLKGLSITYHIKGKIVYIRPLDRVPMRTIPVLPHLYLNIEVTGRVTDSSGSSLPGVTIYVKNNKSIGTTTDLNGRYVIEVPENATLVFNMIGFDSQEIPVKGRKTINVKLLASSTRLGETVVVAFGTQKKEDVVGAVTSIDPEKLNVPSSNLTTALAGRLAGVIAYQRSGEPGADNANFFIRGVTTFGYKKDPLILVDGIELNSTDLARLQPDDIASFSILKDATATALYGARAANGVILITTKEGVEGKAQVSVRFENSISAPRKNVELADPITYMELYDKAVLTRNPLGELPYSQSRIDNTIAGTNPYVYPQTDWLKMLFKPYTMNQRLNFNIKGGGKVARYYLAGTFNQDHGVLKVDKLNNFNNNIDLKSYLLRSNVNIHITKTTQAAIKLYGSFDDYTGPIPGGEALYNEVMQTDPALFPAYYPPDSAHMGLHHTLFGNYEDGNYINPYAEMVRGYKAYSRSLVLAQFQLKQDLSFLIPGLSIRGMFNTTRRAYYSVSRSYQPFYYQVLSYNRLTDIYDLDEINENEGTEYLGYSEAPKQVNSTTYIEAAANYQRAFGKNNVSLMSVLQVNNQIDANAGSLQSSLPHRDIGLSGRAAYSYNHRYFAEFDFGYTGSERFYKTNRFGFFPSVGVAWIVSNEDFWKPLKTTVSNLKLRATYGLVGNDAVGSPTDRFFYLSEVNMNDGGKGAHFGFDNQYSQSGVSVSRYANKDITWEVAAKTNLGFDLSLFDKVQVVADFYRQDRKHILMSRAYLPTFIGLSSDPQANVGEAIGKGMDLSFTYNQYFGQHFWIQAMGNFTYATSEFKKYEEPDYDEKWKSRVGYPLSQQWGYIAEWLFIDQKEVANSPKQTFGDYGPGDIKYRDVNGDGEITPLDQVPIGYPETPEIVYGAGFSLGYKNFDLSCFFQGLARESFWISVQGTAPFAGTHTATTRNALLKVYADNHWSLDNQDPYALWPRFSPTATLLENTRQPSTWFMRNGAFLRFKTAEFGYTLSRHVTEKWHINKVRFYLSGINLFTFSKFDLWDPEMANNGLGYPVQRVENIGVQVSF